MNWLDEAERERNRREARDAQNQRDATARARERKAVITEATAFVAEHAETLLREAVAFGKARGLLNKTARTRRLTHADRNSLGFGEHGVIIEQQTSASDPTNWHTEVSVEVRFQDDDPKDGVDIARSASTEREFSSRYYRLGGPYKLATYKVLVAGTCSVKERTPNCFVWVRPTEPDAVNAERVKLLARTVIQEYFCYANKHRVSLVNGELTMLQIKRVLYLVVSVAVILAVLYIIVR